jgi:hypothetical protein
MSELEILKQQLLIQLENNSIFKKLKVIEKAIEDFEKISRSENGETNSISQPKEREEFLVSAKKFLLEVREASLEKIKEATGENNSVRATRFLMGNEAFIRTKGGWTLKEFLEEGNLLNLNE